jgi:hypothetical protein
MSRAIPLLSLWALGGLLQGERLLQYFESKAVNILVDGRLGSRSQGYHPVAPRPIRYGPFVHRL